MSGYQTILKIRRIEEQLDKLGFEMCCPRYNDYENDRVSVKPKGPDSLPIYNRDAELFTGTFDELELWLSGVRWARDYDRMLFGKRHEANRAKKEEGVRHDRLARALKNQSAEQTQN